VTVSQASILFEFKKPNLFDLAMALIKSSFGDWKTFGNSIDAVDQCWIRVRFPPPISIAYLMTVPQKPPQPPIEQRGQWHVLW